MIIFFRQLGCDSVETGSTVLRVLGCEKHDDERCLLVIVTAICCLAGNISHF